MTLPPLCRQFSRVEHTHVRVPTIAWLICNLSVDVYQGVDHRTRLVEQYGEEFDRCEDRYPSETPDRFRRPNRLSILVLLRVTIIIQRMVKHVFDSKTAGYASPTESTDIA